MLNPDMIFKDLIKKYSLEKKQKYKRFANLMTADVTVTPQNYYYIESGIVKYYYYNKEVQKEVIFCLLSAGDTILPCKVIPYNIPASLSIQVIADAVLYTISDDDVRMLYEKEPIFNELVHLSMEQVFYKMIETAKINVYSDTLTRYEKLLETYPYLRQVSDKNVAAILGVDRTTVTRIKKELIIKMKKAAKPKK